MNRVLLVFLILFLLLQEKGQAQWQEVFYDSTYEWLSDVKFLNNDTGFVCGSAYPPGVIVKTTDGGATWDTTQLCCFWPMSLSIVNSNTIYTCGQDAIEFKTLDGGDSWFYSGHVLGCCEDVSSIYFLNQDTGFAVKFYLGIWRTVDSTTWTWQQNGGSSGFPNTSSIQFINDSIGFVANQYVYRTSDCGSTWLRLNIDTNLSATSIYMKNLSEGIVVGKEGKFSKTADGGNTWTSTETIDPTNTLFDVAFVTDSIGYILGGNDYYNGNHFGNIYITYDGGSSWSLLQSFDHSLTSLYFVNDSIGYAVGQPGRIIKISNANKVGIPEIRQNNSTFLYPNPFHTTATLKITNFKHIDYNLKIYNMVGEVLREEKIFNQSTTIARELLKDGLYIYQLTDQQGNIARNKFVVN
jgi:photosystem II stability/assembly factor-like uncharacterized protein